MSSNEDILKREKIDLEQIPSDAIAYYTPHSQSRKRIYFSKDTLLLMYHLVRLKYFSRDMIFDQYYIRREIGRASCREECRSRWSPYH